MMMTPKTFKRLKRLAIAGLVLAVVSGAFVTYRVAVRNQRIADARTDGLAAFEAGDYEASLHNLGAFLQRNPDDHEVAVKYARSRREIPMPNGRHLIEALAVLRRVVEKNSSDHASAIALLDLYKRLGYESEAADLAQRILSAWPHDEDALDARLRVLVNLKRYDDVEAMVAGLQGDESAPVAVRQTAGFWRARVLEVRGQVAAAIEVSREVVDAEPTPARTEIYTQHVRLMRRQLLGSLEIQDRARGWVAHRPDDAALAALLGVVLYDGGAPQEAIGVLERAAGLDVDDGDDMLFVAQALDTCRQFALATAYLARHGDVLVDTPERLAAILQRLLLGGQVGRVVELTDLAVRFPGRAPSWMLVQRGLALAQLGGTAEQEAVMEVLESRGNDTLAQNWRGVIEHWSTFDGAQPAEVLAVVEPAAQAQPADPLLAVLQAEAWSRVGERDRARTLLDTAVAGAPWWAQPRARISVMLRDAGNREGALSNAFEALSRAPQDAQVQEVFLAAAAAGVDRLDRSQRDVVLQMTEAALQHDISREAAHLARIMTLVADHDAEGVDQSVRRWLEQPEPVVSVAGMVRIERRLAQAYPSAAERVRARLAAVEGSLLAELELARHGLGVGDTKRVLDHFAAARAAHGESDPRAWGLGWLSLLESAGDQRAAGAWRELADSWPNDPMVLTAALRAESLRPDLAFRRDLIGRLRSALPRGAFSARLADLSLRLDEQPDADALAAVLDELRGLNRDAPHNLRATRLLAQAEERGGNLDRAISRWRGAARLADDPVADLVRAVDLMRQLGDVDGARSLARSAAAEAGSGDAVAALELAGLLIDLNDSKAAGPVLARVTTGTDARFAQRVQAARLLRRSGEREAAGTALAGLLNDPTPSGRISAAHVHAVSGDWSAATRAIGDLDALAMHEGERLHQQAHFYQAYGRHGDAAERLARAVELAGATPATWLELIRGWVLLGDLDAASESLAEAQRRFPGDTLLNAAGEIELLAAGSGTLVKTVAGLLLSKQVVEIRPRVVEAAIRQVAVSDPDKAVEGLRDLLTQHPRFAELHLLIAAAEMERGDPEAAGQVAARAMALFPSDVRVARLAAEAANAVGDFRGALAAARRWRAGSSSGSTAAADRFIAEVLLKTGQPSLAADYLASQVSAGGGGADVDWLYARALIAGGRVDAAADHLRPGLSASASARWRWLALAVQLVTQDAKKAATWVDEARPLINTSDPAEAEAFARVQASLAGVVGDSTRLDDAALLLDGLGEASATADRHMTRGMIAEVQGEPDKAIAAYEAALALDSALPAAANNLAHLLVNAGRGLTRALSLARAANAAEPSAEYADTLALVHVALGDGDAALGAWRVAAELEPNDPRWDLAVGEQLAELGRYSEAAAAGRSAADKVKQHPSWGDVSRREAIRRLVAHEEE